MLVVVSETQVSTAERAEQFDEMFEYVAGLFTETRSRRRARAYLHGLLSEAERKNGWTIAARSGEQSPAGIQRLLNFYTWDENAARDALQSYVVLKIGNPGAVMAMGETAFPKKGTRSAGVAKQYTRTTRGIENAQVGVFLAYIAPGGARALIDRELYLPEKWMGERDRCRQVRIGDEVAFKTKPELSQQMIERAVKAGVPFSWVTGNGLYGTNLKLREWLEKHQIPYVLTVPYDESIVTPTGLKRADELATQVPQTAWQRLSCADYSNEPSLYDWALIAATSEQHRLLVRRTLHRNATRRNDLTFFRCWSPRTVRLPELAEVTNAQCATEDCFAEAKKEAGLDQYQVRLYRAWYRHITLSMLAHALITVTTHAMPPTPPVRANWIK